MKIRFSYILLIMLLILYPLSVSGQTEVGIIDTLKSASISSDRQPGTRNNGKFSPGTRVQIFAIAESEQLRSNSLSDFLKTKTTFNIKEYGRGAGSYISLRGTSSSHTSIHWNGMDISMPTLGQTDLSHVPLYFFDDVNIHVGGNSVLYGNGSIGGTITLNSSPKWEEGVSGDILLNVGSYRTIFSGGTLRVSGKKWESKSAFFFTNSVNNFRFTNNTELGRPKERLNNASYRNFGALEEIHRKISDNSLLTISAYYLDFNRDIQPSVSNNDRPQSYKSIYDRNLKLAATYKGSFEKNLHYNANLSYSNDYELYEEDIIAADRVSLTSDAEYRIKKLSVKAGTLSKFTSPNVHSYSSTVKEWNNEIFLLANYAITNRVVVAAGLRESWVTDTQIPIMPSLDLRFKIIDKELTDAILRLSVSKSTKIPTLNDRYWGGNTTILKPEIGKSAEGGLDMNFFIHGWRGKAFISLYYTDVSDWIRWLPIGDIWRPRNIARVLSKGIESGINLSGYVSDVHIDFNTLYGYNNVVTKESERTNDPTIGVQMAYQPKHTLNTNIGVTYKQTGANLSLQYSGKRTTSDIFDNLPAYFLADLSASHTISVKKNSVKINARVRNILNTDYQNVKFFAMPGRNYDISIQYLF